MSENEITHEQMESEQEFAKRVLERTGVVLTEMSEGSKDDLIGSHIFCRRGDVFVVATGYPTSVEEESGQEFWKDPKCFKKITLGK